MQPPASPRFVHHLRPGRAVASAGFTLIEALVAFVVLALLMIVLQRGAVGALDTALRARDRIEAGRVAQSLLASRALAEAGQPASGLANDRNWTVRFEPVPLEAGQVGPNGASVFRPMRMIVSVALSPRGGASLVAEQVQSVRLAGTPRP